MNKGNDELLPVMVFIHGGAFIEGSANLYKPDFIMDHRVVFVAMNYRLAALGEATRNDNEFKIESTHSPNSFAQDF